jgi:hypothetical protein
MEGNHALKTGVWAENGKSVEAVYVYIQRVQ